LAADFAWYIWSKRELREISLLTWVKQRLGLHRGEEPHWPTWLNQDFARRLELPARWRELNRVPLPVGPAGREPAYRLLGQPGLHLLFEGYDPGNTGLS